MFRLLRFRILLAVAAILTAMGWAHHAVHSTEGLMGGMNDPPLAAAAFRAPIVDLESHPFAAGPLTMEDRIVLTGVFDGVRKALEARSGTHMARYSARELRTLAGMSRGLGNLGGADLDRVRQNWMRVRANTFDDAAWFRFNEADPVATPEEIKVPLSAAHRGMIEGLRTALARIEYAMSRGEREADGLGEPEPSGTTDDRTLSRWRDWTGDWRAEMERIRSLLPPAPASPRPSACASAGTR